MNFFLADLPAFIKHLNLIDVYRTGVAAFFGIMCLWMAWAQYNSKKKSESEINEQDLADKWG